MWGHDIWRMQSIWQRKPMPERSIGNSPIAGFEVGLEFFFEGFAAAMDEGFGGGEGAAEDFGDFFVAEVVLAAEEDGATLVFGKFVQGFLDFLDEFAVQQAVRGGDLRFVLELAGRLVFVFGMRFFEGFGGMTGAAAKFVEAKVAGDGKEPGGKFGGLLITAAGFIDLQEYVLGQILGFRLIVEIAENEVHDLLFVLIHEFGKGGAVAALHAEHECGIGVWLCGRFQKILFMMLEQEGNRKMELRIFRAECLKDAL